MRVLIISDIHANLPALETVLADAQRRGFDEVWCLGDVVGYGPDPNGCVERLVALGPQLTINLAGNHDYAVLGKQINVEDFNPEAQRAVLWTRNQLTASSLAYLDTLPGEATRRGDFTLVHGSPRDPVWEYVLSARIARENFEETSDFICCLVGHTHVPTMFSYRIEQRDGQPIGRCTQHRLTPGPPDLRLMYDQARLIVNPGSVGQPRDHDPRASYVLLDIETRRWNYLRIEYPVEQTQHRMLAAGLPERLINRLSFGW